MTDFAITSYTVVNDCYSEMMKLKRFIDSKLRTNINVNQLRIYTFTIGVNFICVPIASMNDGKVIHIPDMYDDQMATEIVKILLDTAISKEYIAATERDRRIFKELSPKIKMSIL